MSRAFSRSIRCSQATSSGHWEMHCTSRAPGNHACNTDSPLTWRAWTRRERAESTTAIHPDGAGQGVGERRVLFSARATRRFLPVMKLAAYQSRSLVRAVLVKPSSIGLAWGFGRRVNSRPRLCPVEAIVLIAALTYCILNLVTDLLYGVVDARIRLDGGSSTVVRRMSRRQFSRFSLRDRRRRWGSASMSAIATLVRDPEARACPVTPRTMNP